MYVSFPLILALSVVSSFMDYPLGKKGRKLKRTTFFSVLVIASGGYMSTVYTLQEQ